jgi:alpha-beta hydrolase superfamily lysophospholipase
MMEQELRLKSVSGKQLWGKIKRDPKTSRAVVVLAHGLGEHIQRYEHVANAFDQRGFDLMGFDQQGHGRSDGKRGVIAGHDSLIRDLEAVIRLAKSMAPDKPVFLYGHSMGALEALYFGLKGQESVQGIIATSPALDSGTMSKAQKTLVKFLKPILPNLAVDNGLEVEALSRDPGVVQRYRNDPLVHPKASVTLAAFMQESAEFVRSHAEAWDVPLYLAHGSADRICPVEGSRQFADQLGGRVTYQEWEGLYHETHNEPEQEQVLATMLDWLETKV